MKCKKCNYFFVDDLEICPNCGNSFVQNRNELIKEIQIQERNRVYSIISLILSLIPYFIIFSSYLGENKKWYANIYMTYFVWPIYIVSLILSIKSYFYNKNNISLISIIINVIILFKVVNYQITF